MAISTVGGRHGQLHSSDAQSKQPVRMPTAMGGDSEGTLPASVPSPLGDPDVVTPSDTERPR